MSVDRPGRNPWLPSWNCSSQIRLDYSAYGFLHHLVRHRRQSERAFLVASRFRYPLPSHGRRPVFAFLERRRDFLQVRVAVSGEFFGCHAVRARASAPGVSGCARVDAFPRVAECLLVYNLVVQPVPSAPLFSHDGERRHHGRCPSGVACAVFLEHAGAVPNRFRQCLLLCPADSAPRLSFGHFPACLPSLRAVYAARPSAALRPIGTMSALTPRGLERLPLRRVSPPRRVSGWSPSATPPVFRRFPRGLPGSCVWLPDRAAPHNRRAPVWGTSASASPLGASPSLAGWPPRAGLICGFALSTARSFASSPPHLASRRRTAFRYPVPGRFDGNRTLTG